MSSMRQVESAIGFVAVGRQTMGGGPSSPPLELLLPPLLLPLDEPPSEVAELLRHPGTRKTGTVAAATAVRDSAIRPICLFTSSPQYVASCGRKYEPWDAADRGAFPGPMSARSAIPRLTIVVVAPVPHDFPELLSISPSTMNRTLPHEPGPRAAL
jgi:hypothetical protein